MHLPVVLFAVILPLEAVRARPPTPFVFAIEEILHGRGKMYCHMAFKVVGARADVAAIGLQAAILGRRGWGSGAE